MLKTAGPALLPPDTIMENPFGLINMLGNVAEFCSDWYAARCLCTAIPEGMLTNPTGPESGEEHVIRGGSFRDDADQVRCASRDFTKYGALVKDRSPDSQKCLVVFRLFSCGIQGSL